MIRERSTPVVSAFFPMRESRSVETPAVDRSAGSGSRTHTLALLVLAAILWLPRLAGPIDLRWDAGVYYVLGTSLAEGKGYRLLSEPGEIEAVQYPPLLPAVVALFQRSLGSHDPLVVGRALRVFYLLLSLAYPLAIYALARRFLPPRYALFTATLTTLHVQTYFLSDLLFAEIPFALVTVLFVISSGWASRAGSVLAGILAVAAYLLRSVGIAVLLAWVGESLLNRRFRQAALRSAVALAPVVLWQGYVAAVTSGAGYLNTAYPFQRAAYQYYNVTYAENIGLLDPFRPELGGASPAQLAGRFATNAAAMAVRVGEGTLGHPMFFERLVRRIDRELGGIAVPQWLGLAPAAILSVFVWIGIAQLVRQGAWLIASLILATLGLICLTPWPGQFSRYLAPLTPYLGLSLSLGLLHSRRVLRGGARGGLIVGAAVGGLLVTQSVIAYAVYRHEHQRVRWGDQSAETSYRLFFRDETWSSFDACLDWLKAHAATDDVVVTSAPQYAHVRTGLKAVMPPMEVEVAEAQRLLDAVPARYVVVDGLEAPDMTRRYAEPVVRSRPDLWELASSPPGGSRVYRRRPRAGPR
jgi:hypothetical protein